MLASKKLLMKRFWIYLWIVIFYILSHVTFSFAQAGKTQNITLVVSETGVSDLIKGLLPYSIDFGKGFSGSFWIKSIDNINIEKGKVLFSTYIYGKDIKYTTKIINQVLSVAVGHINLHNNWETSLRYDKIEKILYVKPHIDEPKNTKDQSQGDMLLNALLQGLSDLEFPISLKDLKPITTDVDSTQIIIQMDIIDIYADNDMLYIETKPNAKKAIQN
jgi:hypothetical protein